MRRRYVDGSGTVGPDPMTLRSSPTTSDIARHTVGPGAAAASRPPLTADKCLRIGVQRGDVGARLQQRVHRGPLVFQRQGAGGHGHQRRGAAREQHDERVIGIGPLRDLDRAASRGDTARIGQRMARRNPLEPFGQAIGRCVPITMPSRMRSPASFANVSAMKGAALPTAMTRRPLPCMRVAIAGSCRARSMRWCGDAASMAPRAMVRKCWRNCDRGEFSVNVLRIGPARQPRHHVELPQQAADDLIGVFLG